MLLGLARERERAGGGRPRRGFPQVVGWKGSPHLERTPRSVAAATSEVSPQPTPCRAHCLSFNSFCNLYLEQLLAIPKIILSAAFSNSQVLNVATSPSATGPRVPRQECDPTRGCWGSWRAPWPPLPDHGLLTVSFPPPKLQPAELGWDSPPAAGSGSPQNAPGLPL